MNRGFVFCVVGLLVVLAGCAGDRAAMVSSSPVLSARPHSAVEPGARSGMLSISAAGSHAAAYVPASIDTSTPTPLMVVLHGARQRGRGILDSFRAEADARGAIVLAPNSTRWTWDLIVSYGRGDPSEMAFGDDVAAIDELLSEMFTRYAVDPERVVLAGFSDGASYALSLGTNNPDLFAGVVAVAPGLISSWPRGADVRIYIAHGEGDRILPVELSRDGLAPQLAASGVEVELEVFAGGHEVKQDVLTRAFDWLGWSRAGPE